MARHRFGGGAADWAFGAATADGVSGLAQLRPGVQVTLWNAESGGTQYEDLLDADEGPITAVTTSDGSDGRAPGTIPPFYGPDEVVSMWAEADGGPRVLLVAADLGETIAQVAEDLTDRVDVVSMQAAAVASDLSGHLSATNPHSTQLTHLVDVDASGATTGQVLVRDSDGTWRPTTIEGATDVVRLTGEQTIDGRKIFQNSSGVGGDLQDSAVVIFAPSGTTADILRSATPARNRVFYLNEVGEPRAISHQPNTVALRIKQRDSSQTADLTQWTENSDNVVLARVTADGRILAPNSMHAPWIWSAAGDQVQVGEGAARIYNDTAGQLVIRSVRASAGVPPTGDSILIDVKVSGASVLTSPLEITAGTHTSGRVTALATTTIPMGGYMTVDILQLGSDTPGDHITVQLQVA